MADLNAISGVSDVHKRNFRGEGIKVGVVDTGIDYRHGALGGCFGPNCRVVAGYDFAGDKYNGDERTRVEDPDPLDSCNGHGTHVAGIIAANDAKVTGVAPAARLGAYRVTGCKDITQSDVIVAGMERAYLDGMDVINVSMLGLTTWHSSPDAVYAEYLAQRGVIVVAAAGNSGTFGMWLTTAPAISNGALSVASVDGARYMATVFTASTDVDRVIEYYSSMPGNVLNYTEIDVGIVSSATVPADAPPDGACSAVTGNYTGRVAVVRRGGCQFFTKVLNVQRAGAVAAIIYNNPEDEFASPIITDSRVTIPGILIDHINGAALVENIRVNGTAVNVTFAAEARLTDNPNSGLISLFSSWGPGPELDMKPDLAAPGGGIYSTWPVNLGGYASDSGTSMSSPYIAGAVALYKQARGATTLTMDEVRRAFQNAGKPVQPSKGNRDITSVARQGAGVVNVAQAVFGTTRVWPSRLLLNDTQHTTNRGPLGGSVRTITVTNTGNKKRLYRFTHRGSASMRAIGADGMVPNVPTNSSQSAVAIVFPPLAILDAGASQDVTVTIFPPPGLSASEKWVYSGYIIADPKPSLLDIFATGVLTPDAVHVPYLGMKGNMNDIQPLGTAAGYPYILNYRDNSIVPEGGSSTYTFKGYDFPYVALRVEFPVRRVIMRLYNADTNQLMGLIPDSTTYDFGRHDLGTNTVGAALWDGGIESITDGTITGAPNGRYIVQVMALRPFGNPNNDADYDTWRSPTLIVAVGP
ncbi:peptidase S8/S53 domain-containing protein [Thamnocephalis sphaerospora]|uniref:Peptidase S8/S53 domain-containing protein n=1 Tax=Thamnocephalis sphaerospora TaxID=78915 RepID=A0A4P9XVI5_9FUNG|nr:peptidase S8/S53 domain-containing protein [Thamnocephalis sphaerospora]|eukprot:RKP10268.1 peptidase S8/S53 domain-containing protein [Thamnocephalis sphaerospora]